MNNSDSSAMARLSGTLGNVLNLFIGLIFAIYVLAQKEKLKRQTRNLLQAYLKPSVSDAVWKVGKLTSITFQKFISGQCLEACILGTMFFITMTIFKIQYENLSSKFNKKRIYKICRNRFFGIKKVIYGKFHEFFSCVLN